MANNKLVEFQNKINYKFKDVNVLKVALTHSSYANEKKKYKLEYNERLEFLGDSVLSIIVSEYIFKACPNRPEGELTKLRAMIVCEGALAIAARNVGLGDYLFLGKGEELTGGRERSSVLADAFEATIGAIYLDGNLEAAREFVLSNLSEVIGRALSGEDLFMDYKTQFQELLQREHKGKIEYVLSHEEGPDHNKVFYTELYVGEQLYGMGFGKSKKESEQNAAKEALDRMCKN